jgi:hypothetical protein
MPALKKFPRYIAATAKNPAALLPGKEYIFILSHMRAHTSVWAHILGSHPEISGHSEMHQGYSTSLDLLKLRCKVSMDNSNRLTGRYVLDKLVNDYALDRRIITAPNAKVIFLLRRPESALNSIISMGRQFGGADWHTDPRKVQEYYVTRLSQLEDIAKMRAEAGAPPAFFCDSQLLLDRTTLVLRELTQWLGLTTELSAHYEIFETTGHAGWGDPSRAIRSAQIVKPSVRCDRSELQAEILTAARAAFDRVSATLRAVCRSPTLESR